MTTAVTIDDPHTILGLLPSGVVVVGSDWRVRYANPEAMRLLGAHGDTLWQRCPALERTAFASGFRIAMADRTELLTESALPAVGWCQARARPTPDGGLLISLRQVSAHTLETGQARHALLIGELGDALTREDSLYAALQRSAVAMVRHLGAAQVRIWSRDLEAPVLELCASAGLETRIDGDHARIVIGQHKIGQIAEDGVPYLTNEVATDPHVGRTDWVRREGLVAFAGYPLRIEDRIVGVLTLFSTQPLDHEILNTLSRLADALALGIARTLADAARRRAESQLRAQAERLELLHQLGQQLAAELDSEVIARQVITAATCLTGARTGAFFYHQPSNGQPARTAVAVSGPGTEALARGRLPRMTPLLAPAFVEDRVVRIADVRTQPSHGALGPHFGLPPGHPPVASFLAVPVTGRSGRKIGTLLFGHPQPGVFSAETERLATGIAATAAIAIDNARLFHEARELITALEKSNAELDQFAYVASHDLKAPLRGIANLALWIEEDLGPQIAAQTREHIQLLRRRVLRLESLVGGILAYSRAGRERSAEVEVDLRQLALETWELIAPPATAHLTIAGALPSLVAARVQLQQVLLNLIGNAIKHNAGHNPGRELRVTVGARREATQVVLWVQDDGIGIAAEAHDRIWELFQAGEPRAGGEGTGIGLSVVRKIVDAHLGRTWVESTPGAGATFYVAWPIAPPA